MIYGLHVEHLPTGYYAMLLVELGWTSPPPVDAIWRCCDRSDVDAATVIGNTWVGFGDAPDVWVNMSCPDKRLVRHLSDAHDFRSAYR